LVSWIRPISSSVPILKISTGEVSDIRALLVRDSAVTFGNGSTVDRLVAGVNPRRTGLPESVAGAMMPITSDAHQATDDPGGRW
jgi:hypothetical protein